MFVCFVLLLINLGGGVSFWRRDTAVTVVANMEGQQDEQDRGHDGKFPKNQWPSKTITNVKNITTTKTDRKKKEKCW